MITICERCKKPREVTRIRTEVKYCRTCSMAIRRKKLNTAKCETRPKLISGRIMHEYKRICACGDEKWVTYIPKPGAECRKCSSSRLGKIMAQKNKKPESERIRYKRKCIKCGKTDTLIANPAKHRKTSLCGHCSSSERGKANRKNPVKETKPLKRYFQYCDVCEDTREVSQSSFAQYGFKTNCRKHAKRKKTNKKSNMQIIKEAGSKPKSKEISQASIKKIQKINRDHRKAVENITEKKSKMVKQKKTNDQMMTEFLKENSVTVIKSSYYNAEGQTDCSRAY